MQNFIKTYHWALPEGNFLVSFITICTYIYVKLAIGRCVSFEESPSQHLGVKVTALQVPHQSTQGTYAQLAKPFDGTVAAWEKCVMESSVKCVIKPLLLLLLLLLLLIGVRCARPGDSENTLSVQRPQPHTASPWKEEKDKTVGDKKERGKKDNENISI